MSGTGINWDSADLLRLVADLTGDGRAGIVGFGADGVWTALGDGGGALLQARKVLDGFNLNQGWRTGMHPRFTADLTGDGRADLVGFGDDGVWTAIGAGDGTFAAARYVLADLGFNQGWRVDQHPRLLADLTGDGKADIVGFGNDGVWTALNNGDGSFAGARLVLAGFNVNQGWQVGLHPRFAADLTGDGRADIVGFGNDGVWTALGNGDGTFAAARYVLAGFGSSSGWRVDKNPLFLADLTGNGRLDIVGFGDDGIWTALGNGDGTFGEAKFVLAAFAFNQGWRVDRHPRFIADLNGDGRADIVGFGDAGIWTALSNGDGGFAAARYVLANLGADQGWTVDKHPRCVADLNGDRGADIVGFGDAGVWTALGSGDGGFAEAKFVLADFGLSSAVQHRVISFDYLQRKFNVFFNDRERPLFQLRLNSEHQTFGESTLVVAVDSGGSGLDLSRQYDFTRPMFSLELASSGPLDFSVGPLLTYKYYFQDLNSDKLTLNLVAGEPLALALTIHFETQGLEIKVEGSTGQDIDLDGFNIVIRPEITRRGNSLDLFGFVDEIENAIASGTFSESSLLRTEGQDTLRVRFRGGTIVKRGFDVGLETLQGLVRDELTKRFITADVSVNVGGGWPDGTVASRLEGMINSRIYDALKAGKNSTADSTDNPYRDGLNTTVKRWLVGGDFIITGVVSDSSALKIDYVVPPGQLPPFPDNPQPPLDQGLLANIEHIVVLMMENRSFDHMLGYLSLGAASGGPGRADVDGLRDPPNAYANPYKGKDYPSFRIDTPNFMTQSPPHEHDLVEGQIDNGKMDGFVREYAEANTPDGDAAADIMGYYDAANVPVYHDLAKNFLVCQRWFASHPGPTFCNRFYYLTGRLNRSSFENYEVDNFSGANFKPVVTSTVFDHLSARGVSWRFYEQRYCTLRLYAKYSEDDQNIVDFEDSANGFVACAAAGTLPSVTFIDPNFIDEPDAGDNDDAAPGNILAGQALIGKIVNALMHGPKWGQTLFVVTYDEHGGFFDHVSPLDPAYREKAVPVSGIDHYGVRVPTFVVSSWVAPGTASDVVFDHTSIIKTIARRFMSANPPDMGERVAAANDLSAVLQQAPQQGIPTVASPPPPAPTRAAARPLTPSPDSTEFKDVMRLLLSRSPLRQ